MRQLCKTHLYVSPIIVLALASCSPSLQIEQQVHGPDVHLSAKVVKQDINLSDPPSGYIPPDWKPGDPVHDAGDLIRSGDQSGSHILEPTQSKSDEAFEKSGESWATDRLTTNLESNVITLNHFSGMKSTGTIPPDTVGDAGISHYIQMTNHTFQIFDKTGVELTKRLKWTVLWADVNSPCTDENSADPIVRYDHLADRWLLSWFTRPDTGKDFYECVAISQSTDPVDGGWYLYEFQTADGNPNHKGADSPKISVWPDAYYMTAQSDFPNGQVGIWALERDKMLLGQLASMVHFWLDKPAVVLLPADFDGSVPPIGSPGLFARQMDCDRFEQSEKCDRVEVYEFLVDWADPESSVFGGPENLPVLEFDSLFCTESDDLVGACIPQPGLGSPKLETLSAWPMWRLQYRNLDDHETMVFNHTINVGKDGKDLAAVRWYELRRNSPDTSWSIEQQGTYSPDNLNRWMGSIAMDKKGNIALGYSVSSEDEYPGIRIASRLATDQPGSLPQVEFEVIKGAGYQEKTSGRYGNYSSMDLDPVNECLFWYTNEYYSKTSIGGWKTRIISFQLPGCDVDD